MPAVHTSPAKSRRRKPVAKTTQAIVAAAPATAGTNPKQGATVTFEIRPIKKLQAQLNKLQALYLEPRESQVSLLRP